MHPIGGIIHGRIIELTDDPGLPDGDQVRVVVWPVSAAGLPRREQATLPGPPPG
jgi:hypothetical protein